MACATMWAMAPAEYQPTPEYLAAREEYERAVEALEAARVALRDATITELKTQDVTVPALTKQSPWSMETVRTIARESGVPRRREPTVISAKAVVKPRRRKP